MCYNQISQLPERAIHKLGESRFVFGSISVQPIKMDSSLLPMCRTNGKHDYFLRWLARFPSPSVSHSIVTNVECDSSPVLPDPSAVKHGKDMHGFQSKSLSFEPATHKIARKVNRIFDETTKAMNRGQRESRPQS